jgi:hypothetical protein
MNTQKGAAGPLFGLALAMLVAPGVVAGCATDSAKAPTWTAHPATAAPMTPAMDAAATASKAWASRPAYVRQNARTEEAYAYAMASPEVLRWMPCYCGCGAMGHGSNLDCFFKPTTDGAPTFEEHASFCGICVDTALMAKRMAAEGQSLRAIRGAIDATFGGAAPGTPTELPPV